MATSHSTLTGDAWTAVGTGLSVLVIQFQGPGLVHVGDTAPANSDRTGFYINANEPVEVPQVAALGGSVWVRSVNPTGGAVYASA